jgi:hypothetical protein
MSSIYSKGTKLLLCHDKSSQMIPISKTNKKNAKASPFAELVMNAHVEMRSSTSILNPFLFAPPNDP